MIDSKALLESFGFNDEDAKELSAAGAILESELRDFIEDFYVWLAKQAEFAEFFGSSDEMGRVKELQVQNWKSFFGGVYGQEYFASRRHIGVVHWRIGLPNNVYCAAMATSLDMLTLRLKAKALPRDQEMALEKAVRKMVLIDTFLVLDTIHGLAKDQIAEHSRAITDLSTPVTPIWDGILLLPLVGVVDSMRTQDIMDRSLSKIASERAKVFILDIAGVAAVDTSVANQLIKITRSTRLMGCDSIISGITPSVARTLVELGISVGEVQTTATLRDAFEIAFAHIGVRAAKTTVPTS